MNILKMSLFDSHMDIHPKGVSMTLSEAKAFFEKSHARTDEHGNVVVPSFSMAVYRSGGTRRKENVTHMTGVVLDIDVKGPKYPRLSESLAGDIERDILRAVHVSGKAAFVYKTKSWSPVQPCMRVIFPREDIPVRHWWKEMTRTYEWFEGLVGGRTSRFLDNQATRDVSRMWLLPA